MSYKENYDRLKYYVRKYKWWFIGGIASSVIFDSSSLVIPWILKLSIESLRKTLELKSVTTYALLIVAIALAGTIFRIFSRYLLFGASRYMENDIREDLFSHLQKQSPSFYQNRKTGDIISRATNDLTTVRMFIGFGTLTVISTGFTFVFAIAAMAALSIKLTLMSLLPYPLIFYVVKKVTPKMFKISKLVQEQLGEISSKVQENMSGIQVLKSYVQEENERKSFLKMNMEYLKSKMKTVTIMGALFPLMGTLGGIGTLIILWQGGKMVVSNEISLGDFVAFNSYLALLIWPSIALGWIFALVQRGLASFERICEILREAPEIADGNDAMVIESLSGNIRLENLSFLYPKSRNGNGSSVEALKNINLSISEGESVAIVGKTGAGKSTLIKLLLRLFDVEKEKIFIDNTDITKIPLNILRKSIGYVPQESFLFNATIHENVAYADDAENSDKLRLASDIAQLSKDVNSFPEGFNTMIGERGVNLSGGQRQRVCLARSIISPASIFIFDDPISSVDADTEKDILENLKQITAGKTTIFITHRIQSIKNFDKIVVMENGEICETGTHEELMALNGIYYELYNQQLLMQELEKAS